MKLDKLKVFCYNLCISVKERRFFNDLSKEETVTSTKRDRVIGAIDKFFLKDFQPNANSGTSDKSNSL